ncbi:MAG: M56 family metallopeptidase, partial [Anaerolineales bacterium]
MDSIIQHLDSLGGSFVKFALSMGIQSSILIVILLGLDFVLRKKVRAIFRYCIWMLVLVKLVLPTTLSAPTGMMYWFGDKIPQIVTERPLTVLESPIQPIAEPAETVAFPAVSVTEPSVAGIEPMVTPAESIVESIKEEVAVVPVATEPVGWQAIVFLVWSAVVMMMVLLLIQRVFFVRGLIAQSRASNGSMVDILEQCCRQMGIKKKISLKLSPNVTSPSVCGLFRPVILMPQDLPDNLNQDHIKAVLLHELAHIKRGDLMISFVQTVLQIVYFYNPLLWLANAMIRRVREQAVDEMVMVAMGETAQQYPDTLINVARMSLSRPALG